MAPIPEFKFALREDLQDKPEFLPARANPTDTGYDVKCANPEGVILKPFEYFKVQLGFRIFAPKGWWLSLHPRSSAFFKKHLNVLYGVIDEAFSLEAAFLGMYLKETVWEPVYSVEDKNQINFFKQEESYLFSPQKVIHTEDAPKIEFGERIGQLIPFERQDMLVSQISNEEFDELVRVRGGRGGFGSTGEK